MTKTYLMSKKLKQISGVFLLILLLLGVLHSYFGDIMKGGHDRFFTSGGDGFKNYSTVIYHVKHDKDWLHYEGMNYPYGEHILFTDNQPLLVNTLKLLKRWFPDIAESIAPTMHWMMLFGLIFSGVFLLLIFRKFNIPDWFSISVSIGIVLLSPQLLRMGGHFGLAYAVVLPLYIYLLLLFEEKRTYKYLVFLFLSLLVFAQLHFYYFGILALLTFGYGFFRIIFAKAKKQLNRRVWMQSGFLAGITVLSYILLNIWVKWGNNITDRPSAPLGFLHYKSRWESIFLSEQAPFLKYIHEHLIHFRATEFEGKSYIGLLALVIFISLMVKWFKGKTKVAFFPNIPEHRLFVRSLFGATFVLLLFSMGLPFIIPGLEGYVKFLGPLSQLRSIGRFGWIFFYVINIFGLIYLYNTFQTNQNTKQLKYLLLFPILILFTDGFAFLSRINSKLYSLTELNRNFDKSNQYWFKDINPKVYQAILPVPYFHIGSENYDQNPKGGIFYQTTSASIWSGLPSMGVMMSRTSFSQSSKSIGMMMSLGYRVPEILNDLPSKKPLLAFVSKEAINHRKVQSLFVKNYGHEVFQTDKVIGYKVPLDAFAKAVEDSRLHLQEEINTRKLYNHGKILSTDSLPNYIYHPFEQTSSKKVYNGQGAFEADVDILRKDKSQIIFDKKMPNPRKGQQYEISFWIFIGQQLGPIVGYKLYEYDPQDPKKVYTKWHKGVRFDMKKLDNGWAYMTETLTLQADNSKIKLEFLNDQAFEQQFWIDELIFRPKGTDLYQVDGAKLWKNGLFYE